MRGLPSTIALLVALVGLGGYIYFGNPQPSSEVEKKDKLFTALDAATIEGLTVKSTSGDTTTLAKDAGAWKLTAPIAAPAAETDVTSIATALADIEVVRVVDENPANLNDYGLDAPRIEVSYKTAEGKSSGKLLLGGKTTTGGNVYARRDDSPRVVLVAEYHETTLNKSTFDLRDKAIVKLDRTKVDGADVTVGTTSGEFAKTDGEWRMTRPVVARADTSALEALVGNVEGLQMKAPAMAQPTPEQLKTFGLDKPAATINLRLGAERLSLLVGGTAADGAAYVRDASKPDVFVVEAAAANDLKKAIDDYRKKELFDFRAFNATRVEVTRNGKTLTVERVKATEEGKADTWKRLSPTAGDPDSSAVQNFLANLADIRAVSFVDAKARTGLQTPAMTVVAKFDEGKKEERVTFGQVGADAFAARPDDPGASKIDAEKLQEAFKTFDELTK
jgi:hypothetical protein